MSEAKKIIKAKLGFVRQTPRKLRRTANLVRNKTAGEAVTQLGFMPYAAAEPILKLITSAMANAGHNQSVENPSALIVSQLLIDDGVIYKRWRAANKGRAHGIKKRSAKLQVVLSEMTGAEYAKYVWEVSPRNKKLKKDDLSKKKVTTKKTTAKKETAEKTTTKKKAVTKKKTTATKKKKEEEVKS